MTCWVTLQLLDEILHFFPITFSFHFFSSVFFFLLNFALLVGGIQGQRAFVTRRGINGIRIYDVKNIEYILLIMIKKKRVRE